LNLNFFISLQELRMKLLKSVEKLAESLGYSPDVAYTAETSEAFYTSFVLAKWEQFELGLYVLFSLLLFFFLTMN